MEERRPTAIVVGAGPAGLTAAWELLDRTDIRPVVLEATGELGGIARTVAYKGNRMDIGGHRFFSKSDRVMEWWLQRLPLQGAPARDDLLLGRSVETAGTARVRRPGQREAEERPAPDPEREDRVMLLRRRLSRILYLRRFFPYPLSLGLETLRNLGPARLFRIGASYLRAAAFPIRPEKSLEDFFVNRFGRELYATFFRDYTEKVWGVPCAAIRPEWGAQRVKGLSVLRALKDAAARPFRREADIRQKERETSLIERFLYPKLGPGQMWETVAGEVQAAGGEVRLHRRVVGVRWRPGRIEAVVVEDPRTGLREEVPGDLFFSTMAVKDLVAAMGEGVPREVREVASGLQYRAFVTVGVLLNRLRLANESGIPTVNGIIPDNWIYVQEPDVKLGRLQVFNNWSPYLVADPETVWLGLEYFCDEGDDFWRLPDEAIGDLAVWELAAIGVAAPEEVRDRVVVRQAKTYPAYFGTYDRFHVVRAFLDSFQNLFPLGRNGMHKYNNQDHSMLTAMTAVDNLLAGSTSKENLWAVNTEAEYHEEGRRSP
ncbi:MAG: NAD(P)/FAD-dependent oxidoreductase [Acidobacteriota bacterium]